ncbi:unnamed protein product [Toxocara canis]|uniref:HTH CENPB-type domain-containing protein n=1 Tax=Toxocara canis TaxID=6265 RepID=A0A183V220_TOXCA|nr:unnamed protein product [Toxocara canis]
MVMSINISLSESGPINLDDILKEATAFRSEDTSRDHDTNTETHTALESSELACTQKLFGSAKRKTRYDNALEARTLRTIAGPSSTSADVANGDVRKRQSYTLLFKRECVRRIRHGGISMNQMSRETGIDRRCLRSWLKQEAQLLEESQVECTRKRVSGGGRKASYYQVEKKLNEWYQAEALAGRDVTYRKLNIVAYRFAKECGVLNPINFSKEFLIKWQKKNHLMFKTKNAHVDSYPASTSSSSFDLSSDEPEPKSLIDLLFEGIEGQFADVEAEVCEASTSASTLPPQHSATVFAERFR